jgi:hypothetical protein
MLSRMGPNHLQTIAKARIPSFDPRQTCAEHQLGSPDLWLPSSRLAAPWNFIAQDFVGRRPACG